MGFRLSLPVVKIRPRDSRVDSPVIGGQSNAKHGLT